MEDYELHLIRNFDFEDYPPLERNVVEEKKLVDTYHVLYKSKEDKPRKISSFAFVEVKTVGKYSLMIKRGMLSVGKYLENGLLYIYKFIHPNTALKLLQTMIDNFEEIKKLTEEMVTDIMAQNSFMILKLLANLKKENLICEIEEVNYLFKGKKTKIMFGQIVKELHKELDDWIGEQFDFLMSNRSY